MKLAGSLERAQAIGPGQSAKARDMHYDLENELEHGLYNEDEADEGEAAIAHLEANHPGVREASRGLTRPPALSRSAKRSIDGPEEDERQDDEEEDEPELPTPRRRSSPSRSSGGGRRSGGGGGRRSLERAAGFSGDDVSGAVIRGLQLLLAAGIAYQVLQPKGSGALSSVLGTIGGGVRAFIEPVDPLGSSASTVEQAYQQVQKNNAAAAAANPNVVDTPTGTAPYDPGSLNLGGGAAGNFDTPGGLAPYKPPTNIPGLKIVGGGRGPTSPLQITLPNLTLTW